MPEHGLDKTDLRAESTGISAGECNWIFHLEGMTGLEANLKYKLDLAVHQSLLPKTQIRTGWLYSINHS